MSKGPDIKLLEHYHGNYEHFAEDCIVIRDHDTARLLPLKFNRGQAILHTITEKVKAEYGCVRILLLKSRRFGGSTYIGGRFYWRSSLNPNRNVFILAHEKKSTSTLFEMAKLMQQKNPIAPSQITSNARELVFDNEKGTGLKSEYALSTAKNVDAGRSQGIHYLLDSEEAMFPSHAEQLLGGLFQCVPDLPMETEIFRESTANGYGNTFQIDVMKAYAESQYPYYSEVLDNGKEYNYAYKAPDSDWVLVFIPWFIMPKYSREFESAHQKEAFKARLKADADNKESINYEAKTLKKKYGLSLEQLFWREQTIINKCRGSVDKFHEDYPTTTEEAFLTSGRNVFEKSLCDLLESMCIPPIRTGEIKERMGKSVIEPTPFGRLSVWEMPDERESYFMTVDSAGGKKKRHIKEKKEPDYVCIDVWNHRTGAQCAQWRGHMDYDLISDLAKMIGDFYFTATACVELLNHGYTVVAGLNSKDYPMYEHKPGEPGWYPHHTHKTQAVDNLKEDTRDGAIHIRCKETVSEMRTYVEESGRYSAETGCKDDRVTSSYMASEMLRKLDKPVKNDFKIGKRNFQQGEQSWMVA